MKSIRKVTGDKNYLFLWINIYEIYFCELISMKIYEYAWKLTNTLIIYSWTEQNIRRIGHTSVLSQVHEKWPMHEIPWNAWK